MALGPDRLRSIIESILMLSPEPVPLARLVEVIQIEDTQTEADDVRAAIAELLAQYRDPDRPVARGMRIDEVGGGLQFRTTPENAQFVRRFLAAKPQRLSKASLETLSIIAYRQPCTKPEVESVRGVDATAAMRNLLDRDLVKILGKREEVGRPIIYGTTPYFLEFFGLKSLNELPSLREYHELDAENQGQVDELDEARGPSIQELAAAASTLVEPDEADPDLDALDAAVRAAEHVTHSSDLALDPAGGAENGTPSAPKPEG